MYCSALSDKIYCVYHNKRLVTISSTLDRAKEASIKYAKVGIWEIIEMPNYTLPNTVLTKEMYEIAKKYQNG